MDALISEHWLEIILILLTQLIVNIRMLFNLSNRISKVENQINQRLSTVETHIIHIMGKLDVKIRDREGG